MRASPEAARSTGSSSAGEAAGEGEAVGEALEAGSRDPPGAALPLASGEVLGADQRVSVMEALKGITTHAAYQYFEEANKGSLTTGKQADLVILERNPLTVPAIEIKDIKVNKTISRGKVIFAGK